MTILSSLEFLKKGSISVTYPLESISLKFCQITAIEPGAFEGILCFKLFNIYRIFKLILIMKQGTIQLRLSTWIVTI